ncbi:MAG: hypothetical protein JJ854_19125, partial [Pseudomonadales bacterium]|nr:hypothetical protein [Pseudomonadales bacterium]
MGIALPSTKEWVERCEQDGEFMLAARHWSGGLQITVEDARLKLPVQDGKPVATDDDTGQLIEFTGSEATWDKVLAAVPERFNNDLMANMMQGQGLERDADPVQFAQYFAAVARAIELLRPPADEGEAMPHDLADEGTFSAPVGRYVMLTLGGVKHRVYYEEAGEGIPILMQHTAGCSG